MRRDPPTYYSRPRGGSIPRPVPTVSIPEAEEKGAKDLETGEKNRAKWGGKERAARMGGKMDEGGAREGFEPGNIESR